MILWDMAAQGAEMLSSRGGGGILILLTASFWALARWRGPLAVLGAALVLVGVPSLAVGIAFGQASWAGHGALYLVPWAMAVLGTAALVAFFARVGLIGAGDG